jgi:hypothetical protein
MWIRWIWIRIRIRNTEKKCSGSYRTEISKDISRMFLADILRTLSEKKAAVSSLRRKDADLDQLQTFWESDRMVDAQWVNHCSVSVTF